MLGPSNEEVLNTRVSSLGLYSDGSEEPIIFFFFFF